MTAKPVGEGQKQEEEVDLQKSQRNPTRLPELTVAHSASGIWLYEGIIQVSFLPFWAKECHEVKSHLATWCFSTVAPPKYLTEHGCHRSILGFAHRASGIWMYEGIIQVSFLPVLAKGCHEVKSYSATRFSPTASVPKYMPLVGIDLRTYGRMRVSFKCSAFHIGPIM